MFLKRRYGEPGKWSIDPLRATAISHSSDRINGRDVLSSVGHALYTRNERDAGDNQPGEPVIVGHEQIRPRRGGARQLNGVGRSDAFPTADASIPLGGGQTEANQFYGTTREKVEVTPFEHDVVHLPWLGDYLADCKATRQQLIPPRQHSSTEIDYAR